MTQGINTVLIINGAEKGDHSRGGYNGGLAAAAKDLLASHYKTLTTTVAEGYDVKAETLKFKKADIVIYQYPVFWFMVPSSLKRYMDEVFSHGEFFNYTSGPYGSGGLMLGKKVMFSTTWNAPLEAFGDKNMFFDGMTPDQAITAMRKAHQYCGFSELSHFSCHNIVKNPQFQKDQERFVAHLNERLFLKNSKSAA